MKLLVVLSAVNFVFYYTHGDKFNLFAAIFCGFVATLEWRKENEKDTKSKSDDDVPFI